MKPGLFKERLQRVHRIINSARDVELPKRGDVKGALTVALYELGRVIEDMPDE